MEKPRVAIIAALFMIARAAQGQNRGVYPLGMSATASGVTAAAGFTYANQLLYYHRDRAKDDNGNTEPVNGENYVLMDMNSFIWVKAGKLPGDTTFSMVATLPFARNSLASDIKGRISGGGGFADSYYLPAVFGWTSERYAIKAMYGFLAPTGRFKAGAPDNVGSGYWTHTLSSGQTFFLDRTTINAFEMFEYHTRQEGTEIKPGSNVDFDYSVLRSVGSIQIGIAGYNARQTSAKSGPGVSAEDAQTRYAVNALGVAFSTAFPSHKASVGLKAFKEFSNRSTYEGYSLQLSGSIAF